MDAAPCEDMVDAPEVQTPGCGPDLSSFVETAELWDADPSAKGSGYGGAVVYEAEDPGFAIPTLCDELVEKLTAAIRQATFHSEGMLAQVWVPHDDGEGNVSLVTKNQMYILSGVGDDLAEYRDASCNYEFAITRKTEQVGGIGMPGRVYSSELPEVTSNVQMFTQEQYPRLPDARRSHILSSVVVPIFSVGGSKDNHCHCVLELIPSKTVEGFAPMISMLNHCMQMVGLTTFGHNTSEVVLIRNGRSCRAVTLDDLGAGQGTDRHGCSIGAPQALPRIGSAGYLGAPPGIMHGQPEGRNEVKPTTPARADPSDEKEKEHKVAETKAAASVALHTVMQLGWDALESLGLKGIVSENGEEKTVTVGRKREDRPQVSLKTLQDHFVYSLKEAAAKLGMCPTTLKRCCRQHGIQRWPKRRLTSMGRSLTTLQEILSNAHSAETDTPALQKVAEALSSFKDLQEAAKSKIGQGGAGPQGAAGPGGKGPPTPKLLPSPDAPPVPELQTWA